MHSCERTRGPAGAAAASELGQSDGRARAGTRAALVRRIAASAELIDRRYAEPLTVEVLARAANLSSFHFARVFKRVTGQTPHAFLTARRVSAARRLVADGMGVGEAAALVGFGSRTTLFRHLRRADRAAR